MFIEDKLAIIVNLFCILLISYANSLNSPHHIFLLCLNSVLILSAPVWRSFTSWLLCSNTFQEQLYAYACLCSISLTASRLCFHFTDPLANTVVFGFALLRLIIAGSRCIFLLVTYLSTIKPLLDSSLHWSPEPSPVSRGTVQSFLGCRRKSCALLNIYKVWCRFK